ncbi:MAG: hypothetical protein HYV67_02010 [Candidatus Taylorbacteria bacterium]|nr:hypothetical protein [Candidatus Taylorbacteria bacterium]
MGTSEHVQGLIYVWPKVLSKNGYILTIDSLRELRIKSGATEIFHATGVHAAALDDTLALWVGEREEPMRGGVRFEVKLFDLASKQNRIILPQIDNKQNPNSPPIVISGDQIALSTFANTLVLINVKSGVAKTVPLPSEYHTDNDFVHSIGNTVIMPAYKSGTYRTNLLLGL